MSLLLPLPDLSIYRTQAEIDIAIAAAIANRTTPAQVSTQIAAALPVPFAPYNVPSSAISVGNGVLAGLRMDRSATLKGYTYSLVSLLGLNALLGIELRKNGTPIPGTSVSVNTANLTATVVLGSNMALSLGDTVELWRTGLAGTTPVPGAMYGTFQITTP